MTGGRKSWRKVRTCSRVSSGPCDGCSKQTYHQAWRAGKQVLCCDCYEARFEPDKARERKAVSAQRALEKAARLKLALEGNLPGAKITESGMVLGPPQPTVFGPAREVLREGLYDTEPWRQELEEPSGD